MNWAEETVKENWDALKKDDDRYKYTGFDSEGEEIAEKVREHANTQHLREYMIMKLGTSTRQMPNMDLSHMTPPHPDPNINTLHTSRM